jgi:ribose transport system ATP-binding protein
MESQAANSVAAAKPAATEPLIQIKDLHKAYGPVIAVESASLEIFAGEVVALCGENGAGKSTVGKILAGAVAATSGEILLQGQPYSPANVQEARANGVAIAFQELSLVPSWSVAENLVLADKSTNSTFSHRAAQAQAKELLAQVGITHIPAEAIVSSLSLSDRQLVEIARGILTKPRVLILDEASSALLPSGVAWLFERIRELTTSGTAVVYVSHRLPELREIADRCVVMRDGQTVGEFARGKWQDNELISLMAGRSVEHSYPSPPQVQEDAAIVLEVTNLRSQGVNGFDLVVRAGEIVGIGGLAGQGQAEALRALYGATPAKAERWAVSGKEIQKLNASAAVKLGMSFVPEDRKRDGLALKLGVGENLLFPWVRWFGAGGKVLVSKSNDGLLDVVGKLSVKTAGLTQPAGALSGGNQQKLVFGRWLNRSRSVILLHDPTRGVDVRAKQELHAAIMQLAQSGVGVVWLSTEVEELVHMCHRVAVMYEGKVHKLLAHGEIDAESVVTASIGIVKQ